MKTRTELPTCGEHVIVHCNGFRCMGKLENDGKWRAAFRDDELKGVIAWSPVDDDRVIPLGEDQRERKVDDMNILTTDHTDFTDKK